MSFIDTLSTQQITRGKFPVKELLENSLFYPSCGFDGGVIKDCNTLGRNFNISSFIYCDYATGEQPFLEEQNTFRGYHIVASRRVSQSELTPGGWHPVIPPMITMHDYTRYKNDWESFCNWTVYERDDSFDEKHGQNKFSLLYIGGEGVATYQGLYWSNQITPKALAIIQPGTAFGLNWTDFRDKNGALAWVVTKNKSGQPDIIYYGGYGKNYSDFNWDGYTEERMIRRYYHDRSGVVRLFRKNSTSQ